MAEEERIACYFFWKPYQENGCFSQWYLAPFQIGGRTYGCAEQYMMAQKALLFEDTESYEAIMGTSDPHMQQKLGRKVKNFNAEIWEKNCKGIVLEASLAKFSQHPYLRKTLLETGDAMLVEASPYDKIWGIGLSPTQAEKVTQEEWKGTNWLGHALMDARSIIRKYYQNKHFE